MHFERLKRTKMQTRQTAAVEKKRVWKHKALPAHCQMVVKRAAQNIRWIDGYWHWAEEGCPQWVHCPSWFHFVHKAYARQCLSHPEGKGTAYRCLLLSGHLLCVQ